ncbi:MAG: hypothetical protein HYZ94_01965 [Candidatus Omnitrophica bacterium]|nr:hypothetical protein [Candidatus Omnitrophota bacterium]
MLGFILLLSSSALALDVEPLRLEHSIPLDEPTSAELRVTNRGAKPVAVKLAAGPYRHFQPGLRIPSAQDWITLEPSFFTLAPGATSAVTVLFSPPAALSGDPAGEYLAAILVDELPAEEPPAQAEGSSRVSIVPRLALPVYLQVRGRERVEMEVSGLTADVAQPLAGAEGGVPAELLRVETTLKNNGTVHTRPNGTLALFDADGRIVRAVGLGKTPPLLPTATLTIPTLLPFPPVGRYKAVVTVQGLDGALLQREHHFEITEDGRVLSGAELPEEAPREE